MSTHDDQSSMSALSPAQREPMKPGLGRVLDQDSFSMGDAIGGPWGVAEAVIPYMIFTACFVSTRDVSTSSWLALASAVLFAVRRLWRKEPLHQAFGGAMGVGIGAFFALRSGEAEQFFAWSIAKNCFFMFAYALSIVVKWPILGVMLGPLLGEDFHWRKDSRRLRAYSMATWLFVGLFAVRLAYQIPLYLAGQAGWLGVLSIPMGLPAFALVVWLCWIILRAKPIATAPTILEPDQAEFPAAEPG